jgi:hypothetical protein
MVSAVLMRKNRISNNHYVPQVNKINQSRATPFYPQIKNEAQKP